MRYGRPDASEAAIIDAARRAHATEFIEGLEDWHGRAGFDAHVEDEMAMLQLRDADYGWVTEEVKAIADRHAKGRIVSMLEGGYALSALGRSVVQHVPVLAGLN